MSSPNIQNIPVFVPQQGDISMLNRNATVIDMSKHRNPATELGGEVEDFLISPNVAGGNPNLIRYRDRLNNGGTLTTREVFDLATHNTGLATQVTALKARLGHPQNAPISIKTYRDKKAGLAPHRDANFDDSGPASVVDAVGLRGVREFGLWAIPQTIDLDLPDADFMRNVDRTKAIVEFTAKLDGKLFTFRPVRTHTFGPGQGIRINEKKGEWTQPAPSNRPMAIWHSVHATGDEEGRPAISAVIRSASPRSLPSSK